MNKKEMKKILKPIREKYFRKWKAKGNKTTFYTCRHCNRKIETLRPKEDMVDTRGYWDSAQECLKCRKLNFVWVYPSGHTKSYRIGS